MNNFKVYPDADTVARACADFLLKAISDCVAKRGSCHVVLPGGSTPERCLQHLAGMPLPWQQVHWYPGDERCYPAGHEDRNDTMIRRSLFTANSGAIENFHPIPAEQGAEQAASDYSALLAKFDVFDIVLLGMGEDGHTASLFPGNPALQASTDAVAVDNSPKPPAQRVTIGLKRLLHAHHRYVIATGINKHTAIKELMQGAPLPVSLLKPDMWFVDEAAMYGIE